MPLQSGFTYFISDLHLSEERSDILQCFFSFLKKEAITADALYILGDLFEVWIGDDDTTAFTQSVAQAIAECAVHTPVYFIHGNRDFALRKDYAQRANMTLLPEQETIDLYGEDTVILHGDELCTRDVEYMRFRKKARSWWWPRLMLALPLSFRRNLAQKGRDISTKNKSQLNATIMDVTEKEVEETFKKHNVKRMIHGHTHRPAIHAHKINGNTATRIVLGDWYSQGSVLRVSTSGVELQTRKFNPTHPPL